MVASTVRDGLAWVQFLAEPTGETRRRPANPHRRCNLVATDILFLRRRRRPARASSRPSFAKQAPLEDQDREELTAISNLTPTPSE